MPKRRNPPVLLEADETTAWDGDGAGDGVTELLAPATAIGPPLAWSEAAAREPLQASPPWRRVWLWAAVIAVPLGLAAAAIAVPAWGVHRPAPPPVAVSAPVPSSASPPTSTGPRPLQYDARGVPIIPKDPTGEELQQVLVATFDHAGIPYSSPQLAAIDADSVCSYLKSGHHSFAELMGWVKRTHPALTTPELQGGFVGASMGTYCRQFGYLADPANSSATS